MEREIRAAAVAYRFPEWVFRNPTGELRSYRLRLVLWSVVAVTVVTAVTLILAHLVGPADRWIPLTALLPVWPFLAVHLIGENWNADMRPRMVRFEQKGMVECFRYLVSGAAKDLIERQEHQGLSGC